MLKKLRLTHYKGFKSFTVLLGDSVLLMGPNNAGKSTIINALRLCGAAARVAMRIRPTETFHDQGRSVRGFRTQVIADDGYEFGNIHHEFESKETRLDLEFSLGGHMHMVWPADGDPFFWVDAAGAGVITAMKAKSVLGRIGLVPTLTPIEKEEKKLTREHLAQHVEMRLASRHFRNNVHAVKERSLEEYASLIEFILTNTPELASIETAQRYEEGAAWLDLYYTDPASRVKKELFWAGDGIQIWLQILFHLWRTRENKVVILDEPDVFLHPDLQRRLVRVIEASGRQSILSSHAAEVAGEASLSSLVWIERTRSSARRISEDSQLEQFSAELGSAFNLSISRALRAKVALFVEGKDLKVLRVLAQKVGAVNFAAEQGIAVIPIGGFSHWPSVEAFGWIKSQFLGSQVKVRLLLDRDYRTLENSRQLVENMALSDVFAHVWSRKELESYLLEPPALARVSGLSRDDAQELLDEVLESLRIRVHGQFTKTELDGGSRGTDTATAIGKATVRFEEMWAEPAMRAWISPAKDVISGWNTLVGLRSGRIITAGKLAATLKAPEIAPEMRDFLLGVEADLV